MTDAALVIDCAFVSVPGYDILKGAYLRAERGRITVLFGQNGTGKTTMLRVATGDLVPDSGITVLDSRRFARPQRTERFRHLAYLPQQCMLPLRRSVRTVALMSGMHDTLANDPVISASWTTRVGQLSHGQRRYLEVALVLALRRPYVLLDEPFSGVEPRIIDDITERVKDAARTGTGVLLTDHYMQYALPIAEKGYLMQDHTCRDLGSGTEIVRGLAGAGYPVR